MTELVAIAAAVGGGAWLLGKLVVAWRLRRGTSDGVYGTIEGYVGRPGQGKTTLAVQHVIERASIVHGLGKEVVIASNITVRPPEGIGFRRLPVGPDGFDVLYLVRLALELRDREGAVVLLIDEAGICMPARMWRMYGPTLMWLFQQSRKLYVEVCWTAQAETFVDAQLRELTAATHYVTAEPPSTVASRLRRQRPRRIVADTYDRTAVGKGDAYLTSRRVRYQLAFEDAFDTDDFVLPPSKLDGADELLALLQEFFVTPVVPRNGTEKVEV